MTTAHSQPGDTIVIRILIVRMLVMVMVKTIISLDWTFALMHVCHLKSPPFLSSSFRVGPCSPSSSSRSVWCQSALGWDQR